MARIAGRSIRLLFLSLTAVLGACGSGDRGASGTAAGAPSARGVVDSALPIPILLDRFRATMGDTIRTMQGGAATPDALVRKLITALAARDTATLRTLAFSRAEFAWLYYPHTGFVGPPYELGPELVWITQGAGSEKGAVRLLNRFGGKSLRFLGLSCPDSVERAGPNTLTRGCRTRFAVADSAPREMRLFGALLYRDGRYKFLSYANDL